MTAMAERSTTPSSPPHEAGSIGRLLHTFAAENMHEDFREKIYDTVWNREDYQWGHTFPTHSTPPKMNRYLLTSLVRMINAEAIFIHRQIDHEEIPSIALDLQFLYESLGEYGQIVRARRKTLKELRAPLEKSQGRVVDTHVAFLVRSFIESPPPKGEIKPGQQQHLEGYLPAILAVQGIMYGKQVAHSRAQRHLKSV